MNSQFWFPFLLVILSSCSVKWADKQADYGYSFETKNDYSTAMNVYNKAIRKNKKSAELFWRRGNLYARNQNYQQSINDLTRSIEIDSTFNGGYAYWDRAISKERLEDYEGALLDFDKAVEQSPEKTNFLYFRGSLRYRLNDIEGSLSDLNKAIELWDRYTHAKLLRAYIYTKKGLYNNALEDYDSISFTPNQIKNQSYDEDIYYRGICRFESGNIEGACEDWNSISLNYELALKKLELNCK
ncbi:tetratricopeptide repeat protein [Fulvivirga ligni]|uniref:tetratricopeptide repeat protein n=1 Tax=Fulvivirga ligni TaxID=2904246 RepID=UPI001F264327|nr:tetratricopeptide repeat protein [Fulvivirga ligni]UII20571.1 tetratricopeptide repeat protein [Fulvivirga ligni]